MDTLVLSDSYQPIRTVPWKKAMHTVLSGRAEVICEYEDRFVRSATEMFKMPSVIRFVRKMAKFIFRRKVVLNRRNVWGRDEGKCQYCFKKLTLAEFTYDHVFPESRGGRITWDNVVVSCLPCNQKKRNRTPEEAGMVLLKKPIAPKSISDANLKMMWGEHMPQSWKDFLVSASYWHSQLT